jgi:hypothetical protein
MVNSLRSSVIIGVVGDPPINWGQETPTTAEKILGECRGSIQFLLSQKSLTMTFPSINSLTINVPDD